MTGKRATWRHTAPLSDDVPAQSRDGRNPIRKLGDAPSRDYLRLPNTLVREAVCTIGVDAFAVLAFLISHEAGWQTSARDMSEAMNLGRSGTRVSKAIRALAADRRLVLRAHVRLGGRHQFWEYVIRADGSRLTDEEIEKWKQPVETEGRGNRKPKRAN